MTAPDQFQVFWVLVNVDRGYCRLCNHDPEIGEEILQLQSTTNRLLSALRLGLL